MTTIYHWSQVFKQILNRDGFLLVLWAIGISAFAGGFVPAFEEIAKGSGALVGFYETMQNPAMIAITGPTPAATAADYTLGAMYGQTMLLYSALIAAICSALYVVARTRKEEERGLTEYLCTLQVGRLAPLFAVMATLLLVHFIIFAFTASIFAFFDAPAMPAVWDGFLFALAVSVGGLLGAGIAAVCAQLMPTGSGANGLALSIIGLLYLLRAMTDISSESLSHINPLGALVFTYPFTENNGSALILPLVVTVLLFVLAFALHARRDFGASYIHERSGKSLGITSPRSVPSLLVRLNRGSIIGWLMTVAILGAAYGSIYGDMETFLESSDLVKAMFTAQGSSIETAFTATILTVLIAVAAVLPVLIVNKLASEEESGRLSQLTATKTSRLRLYTCTVVLAVLTAILGAVFAAASLGAVGISVMTKTSLTLTEVMGAGLNLLPSLLFFIGLSAFFTGWAPRLRKLTYVYLVVAFMLSYFREILDLPEIVQKIAIFNWLPQMPLEDFEPGVCLGMSLVALVLIILGLVGYRRRDFRESN